MNKFFNVGKNIGWWLSTLYIFWICLIVGLCLNTRNEILIPLIIFFSITTITSAFLISYMYKLFKKEKLIEKENYKTIIILLFLPFTFQWIGIRFFKAKVNDEKH